MSFEELSPTGKALLAIGGGLLIGKIVSIWTEDDSTRENRQTVKKKESLPKSKVDPQTSKTKKSKLKEETQRYIVEVPKPQRSDSSRSEIKSKEQIRKYPLEYYNLSKGQQYNYRQKMASKLIQISKEKK